MNIDDDLLQAFVDGAVGPAARAAVEAALQADPESARRVLRLVEQKRLLKERFDPSGMNWKKFRNELAAGLGQMNVKRPAVFGFHDAAHEPLLLQSIDNAGDIRAAHQQLRPDVTHFQRPQMCERLQHAELRRRQLKRLQMMRLVLGK